MKEFPCRSVLWSSSRRLLCDRDSVNLRYFVFGWF